MIVIGSEITVEYNIATSGQADAGSLRYSTGNTSLEHSSHMTMERAPALKAQSPTATHLQYVTTSQTKHLVRENITDNELDGIKTNIKRRVDPHLVKSVMYFVEVLLEHGSMDLAKLCSTISYAPDAIKGIVTKNSKKVSNFLKAQTDIFNISTATNIVTFTEGLYDDNPFKIALQKANVPIAHSNVAERDALVYFMTLVTEQGSLKMRQLHGYISQATKTVQDCIGSKPENVTAFIMKRNDIFHTDAQENVYIKSIGTSYIKSSKADAKSAPKHGNDYLVDKVELVSSVIEIPDGQILKNCEGIVKRVLPGGYGVMQYGTKKCDVVYFTVGACNFSFLLGDCLSFDAKRNAPGSPCKWTATKVWLPRREKVSATGSVLKNCQGIVEKVLSSGYGVMQYGSKKYDNVYFPVCACDFAFVLGDCLCFDATLNALGSPCKWKASKVWLPKRKQIFDNSTPVKTVVSNSETLYSESMPQMSKSEEVQPEMAVQTQTTRKSSQSVGCQTEELIETISVQTGNVKQVRCVQIQTRSTGHTTSSNIYEI